MISLERIRNITFTTNLLTKQLDTEEKQRTGLQLTKSVTVSLKNRNIEYQQPLPFIMEHPIYFHCVQLASTLLKNKYEKGLEQEQIFTLKFWKHSEPPDHGFRSTKKLHRFSYCNPRSLRSSLTATLTLTVRTVTAASVMHKFILSSWLHTSRSVICSFRLGQKSNNPNLHFVHTIPTDSLRTSALYLQPETVNE